MPTPPLEPPKPKKPPHVLPTDARCECKSQVNLTYADGRYWCGVCQALEIKRLRECNRRLVEALTPSGETKGEYIGEFTYDVLEVDEDGEPAIREEFIPWTTVKAIMKAILSRATRNE